MKLLALDTSSDACSVALEVDGQVVERHALRPKEHTRLLLPMVNQVLAEAGITIAELDAVVPGIGPGSFIGVRIAVSVAQGIAFAGDRKVAPVSSLAAVAAEVLSRSDAKRVAVAQDAHLREVYLAFFERGSDALPVAIGEALLHAIASIGALSAKSTAPWHAGGAGWRRHPELFACNEDRLAGLPEVEYPRARFLLAPAREAVRRGALTTPDRVAPAYVRKQVAQLPAAPGAADTGS